MGLPQVAIVGRPNVGKSSLFNWLAGRRIAIVDPTPGVTRDRLATPVQADGRYFELVDTGGIGIVDVDRLTKDVERQIAYAIDRASVILFVVDARAGLVPLDETVAERLRDCLVNGGSIISLRLRLDPPGKSAIRVPAAMGIMTV